MMAARGQNANSVELNESGLPPKADSDSSIADVAEVPQPDSCTAASPLFDHFIGHGKQSGRHVEADCLGSLDVDDELKLGCLLNRNVRRLLTLEDAIDICRGSPVGFGRINTVGHEAAAGDVIAIGIDCR